MVGGRTLLGEDPRLIVRADDVQAERVARGLPPNPAKVGVLSRPAELRLDSRFLNVGSARIFVCTPGDVGEDDLAPLRARGVEVIAAGDRRVDLAVAMGRLAECGIERVLVEGGGSLNFELLRLGLVDEVLVFVAPLIVGGANAPTLADGAGLPRELAIAVQRLDVEPWEDGGVLLRYKVEAR
jgi:2,5-diamino-6-(ribosylamino)-4(3H)-pyrimidinone 5'-phosphate reductase